MSAAERYASDVELFGEPAQSEPNESPTLIHLRALFDDTAGYVFVGVGSEPFVNTTGKVEHKRWSEQSFSWPREAGELVAHIGQHRADSDVYFTPALSANPLRKMPKRKRLPVSALWVDLDANPHPDRVDRIVSSGGWLIASGSAPDRRHLYVPLLEPAQPAAAEDLNRRLANWLGGDPSVCHHAAYLRPAGTSNHKPPTLGRGPAGPVHIIGEPCAARWSVDQLDDLLPDVTHDTADIGVMPAPEPIDGMTLSSALAATIGEKVTPDMDRSKQSYAAIGACIDAGLTDGQIIAVMRQHAPTVEKWPTRSDLEVTRALRKQRNRTLALSPSASRPVSWLCMACNINIDIDGLTKDEVRKSTCPGCGAMFIPQPGSPLDGPDGYHYTDLGNAERLIDAHGRNVRYVPLWGRWLAYDGGRWRLDHGDTLVAHLAASLGLRLLDHIGDVYGNDKQTGQLLQWIRRSESAAGIAATLSVAACRPGVALDHEALDANPWLLNVLNGTHDLRGQFRPHDPRDLLTMQAAVSYVDGAVAHRWALFLEQVLPDGEVRRFVQRLAGLALLGDQPEHILPILLGGGANGKSTLTKVLATVLGDYGIVASRDVLLALKHDTHPTAKADLFRRRFAHSGELPPSAKLDEAQVKELTGGDRIKARRMREDFWEFSPSHLLWLHANHKPLIEGTDDGIWRRVLLIPFDVQIAPDARDPRLADHIIRDESAGVLNWMLNGLADYLADGLETPDVVRVATDRYRNDSDTVTAFLAESGYQFDPHLELDAGDLLAAHGDWWQAIGATEPEKSHYQRVVAALKERGVRAGRTKSRGRFWRGIGTRGDNG